MTFDPMRYVEGEAPFPPEEYAERHARTRTEMARLGIDLLFVTSPANITWLTGYDSLWYRRSSPTGYAILQDGGALFFDKLGHRGLAENLGNAIPGAAYFPRGGGDENAYGDLVGFVADTLTGRGWLRGTAAVEHWATAPGGPVLRALDAAFAKAGATTVDGSWLVDRVRLRQSPRELAVMHRAAEIADEVMRVVQGELHAGMTELEIQGLAQHELARRGCGEPALRTAVRSGALRGEAHHTLPAPRPIHAGEIVIVDYSASLWNYHVDIARCFALGEPDRRWIDLLEKAAGSLDAVCDEVKPGEPMAKVVEVARRYLTEQGVIEHAWFVGGYVQGLQVTPDWVGHVYLDGSAFEAADFAPTMMTNYENVFDVRWPGGSCIDYIDMIEMTETGLRALSRLPRTLTVI